MNPKRYYSTREVSYLLGVSVQYICRLSKRKGIFKNEAGRYRFTIQDIEKLKPN